MAEHPNVAGKGGRRAMGEAPTSVKRVHVFDHGKLSLDGSMMLFGANLASIDEPERPAQWWTIPLYSVLVECEACRILFDTGPHPDSLKRWDPSLLPIEVLDASEECFLPSRLAEIGLTPDDIDIVVISHMHIDHAGCLEFLRNARVIVHRDEFRRALEAFARPDGSIAYCKADIQACIDIGLQWAPVDAADADFLLVPGVKVLNFGPSHAEGMLGLSLQLPETGHIVLAADACYAKENLGPPPILPGSTLMVDSVGMVRTNARLVQMMNEEGAEIWFGHDRNQFAQMVKAPHGYYS